MGTDPMSPNNHEIVRRKRTWGQFAQFIGLAMLSPVCAEYLAAYDSSTGDPVALITGMLFFVPLYGFPAVLIREISCRAKLGWLGVLSMAAAFGILEAGVIDQSLFSTSYRELETWDSMISKTMIAPLGFSFYPLLSFVGGHIIYSFCAPIAIIDALQPNRRDDPWLGIFGTIACALLYLASAALVLNDHLTTETSHASSTQIGCSLMVAVLLVAVPFVLVRNNRQSRSETCSKKSLLIILLGAIGGILLDAAPSNWLGSSILAAVLFGILLFLVYSQWNLLYTTAIASGFLLSLSLLAFTYFPIFGNPTPLAKYGHNSVLLCFVGLLCYLALKQVWTAMDAKSIVSLKC